MTIGLNKLEVDLSWNKIVFISLGNKKARVHFNSVYNVNGITSVTVLYNYTHPYGIHYDFSLKTIGQKILILNVFQWLYCLATDVSVLQCSLLMQACMCVVFFRNKGRIGGVDDRHQENCK